MGVFTVTGSFGTATGQVTSGDDFVPQRIQIEVDAGSLQTGNSARDGHLSSPEFFDVAQFPKLTFQSSDISLKPVGFSFAQLFAPKRPVLYVARGSLAMRGVAHPVELEFEIPHAPIEDPWQARRIGARGSLVINRTKWGMNWNQTVQSVGALLVGNEVVVSFNTQLTLVK
jgi:polyisoprenoid-binding protein YceI